MKNILIIVVVAILILAGIYFFALRDDAPMDLDLTPDAGQEADENNGDGSADGTNGVGGRNGATNSVILAENETGNFATIASANFTDDGYVAVYKVNSQGETTLMGNTDLLEAGMHTNVSVQLNTVVAEGETIVAVMHQDDGDGEFEFPESDFYLGNSTSAIVSDVDVVDTPFAEEASELQDQVETTLEASAEGDIEAQ